MQLLRGIAVVQPLRHVCCLCSMLLLLATAAAAAAAVAAAGRLKTQPVLLPPCPAQVAAVDEPKLHMWETGIMRITRHPQVGDVWLVANLVSCRVGLGQHHAHHMAPPGKWIVFGCQL